MTGALRGLVAGLLVLVTVLAATLAVPARWLERDLLDTDRYVETLHPLASEPAVRRAVSSALTTAVLDRVEAPAVVERRLSPVLDRTVASLIDTAAFRSLWDQANRASHDELVGLLTGERPDGSRITTEGNLLVVDLTPLMKELRDRLVTAGARVAAGIPVEGVVIEIARVDGLDRAQAAVRTLERVAGLLPWLSGLALLLAVAVARRRGRVLVAAGLGVALGAALLRAAIALGQGLYLDRMARTRLPEDAASAVFDVTTRFLRDGVVTLLVVGGVVAVAGVAVSAVEARRHR